MHVIIIQWVCKIVLMTISLYFFLSASFYIIKNWDFWTYVVILMILALLYYGAFYA